MSFSHILPRQVHVLIQHESQRDKPSYRGIRGRVGEGHEREANIKIILEGKRHVVVIEINTPKTGSKESLGQGQRQAGDRCRPTWVFSNTPALRCLSMKTTFLDYPHIIWAENSEE